MSISRLHALRDLLERLFDVAGIKYEAMSISRWPSGNLGIRECLFGLEGLYTAKLLSPTWLYRMEIISVKGCIVRFDIVDNKLKPKENETQLTGEIEPGDKFKVNEYLPIEKDLTERIMRVLTSAKEMTQNRTYRPWFLSSD